MLDGVTGGDQPGADKADCGGDAQAGVGSGQAVKSHGASFTGGVATTLDRLRAVSASRAYKGTVHMLIL
ncbi:ABC transporter, substrate-binding protein, family 5 [Pseudomonas putida]|uniref:ABC transporter, substrate-binding protein, family 5 n=1 Tax=Pseudomonas putida TaxID=303 RepID=A0A1L7NE07_PSEPU|nr:ABC transporter, substrate-binding protein, family 5 [Pseudomonas putida]GLO17571.1 hypothetical protein PPUJ20188_09650 [Pseudomonas putida]